MTNLVVCAGTEPTWQPTELVSTLLSKGARDVIGHWISHRQFLDENNQPMSLLVGGNDDEGFNGLIHQVNPHLAPAVVCNELLRKGIVEQHDNGRLLLRRSAYMPVGAPAGQPLPITGEYLECGGNHRRRRNDLT